MKNKGSRLERELLHLFYSTNSWMPARIAGSGSATIPAPDLIVGNGSRVLAIECKSGKNRRDINAEQVEELELFSSIFGAEPWVGVRFDNMPWYFLKLNDIGKTKGKHFFVDEALVIKKGIRFEELTGKFKQKKL